MKKFFCNLFIAMISIGALFSCNFDKDNDDAQIKSDNEKIIQSYIASNNLSMLKTSSGLYYKITPTANSISRNAQTGDKLLVKFTLKNISGKIIDYSDPKNNDTYIYGVSSFLRGCLEGLSLMRAGDKGFFIIPSDLAYGSGLVEGNTGSSIPPNSIILYDAELLSIKNENEQILDYLIANNKLDSTTRTSSGLYYFKTVRASGTAPIANSVVTVNYKGKLLDGTLFDSSTGFTFTVGYEVSLNKIIKGFDEAVQLMRVGDKATFILPSSIAYGANGAGSSSLIKGYTPILFELELTSVK